MSHVRVWAAPALLLLASCGGPSGSEPDADRPNDGSPVITVDWKGVPFGWTEGRVVMAHDCLLIADEVIVWPGGTTWDADTVSVVAPNGNDRVRVGSSFEGGGGHWDSRPRHELVDWLGASAGNAVADCLADTGASGLALAYFS